MVMQRFMNNVGRSQLIMFENPCVSQLWLSFTLYVVRSLTHRVIIVESVICDSSALNSVHNSCYMHDPTGRFNHVNYGALFFVKYFS